jgi:hypothetical protein
MSNDDQTIFKAQHNADNPYVILDKRPIENPKLSWKAKGLLAYLLSRPDEWIVRMGDLIKRSTDRESATRTAIQELIDAGHIVRETVRQAGKFDSWLMKVYEQPFCGFPQVDNPQVENRTLSNIESTNNELSNIGEGAKSAPSMPPIAKTIEPKPITEKSSQLFEIMQALANVCHLDLTLNRGKLSKQAKEMLKASPPATAELITLQYNGHTDGYWRSVDWRGRKGELPNLATIRDTWGKWVQLVPDKAAAMAEFCKGTMSPAEAEAYATQVHHL